MLELEEKRLKYQMRTSARFCNHHDNLFGRLALSRSRTFKSGRMFSKMGFLSDGSALFQPNKGFHRASQSFYFETQLKDLENIRHQFQNIHILHFLASKRN